jgi:uncharacterized protein
MGMHFAREDFDSELMIRAYTEGQVTVAGQVYRRSLILSPKRLIEDWRPRQPGDLTEQDLQPLHELGPEIVLLGTGASLNFPPARITASLLAAGIGVEVMDTPAACRTYNILLSEGRAVAAALMLD